MIQIQNTDIYGWETAIRGMRNPMNSWDKSDSGYGCSEEHNKVCDCCGYDLCHTTDQFVIGKNDITLMQKLVSSGSDHRKFMHMILVSCDVTAPLYWWKEYDTYKVGTVANSCSTMHKIHAKEFTLDDFSHDQLSPGNIGVLQDIICVLNREREIYLHGWHGVPGDDAHNVEPHDKRYWWQMIQLLPSSYNQRRTILLNYEVLANIYRARKAHKLDEWRYFCQWIETLLYSDLITGGVHNDVENRA